MSLIAYIKPKTRIPESVVDHITVDLPDGKKTKIHVARYLRSRVQPRLVVFDHSTSLLKWCKQHHIKNAINGGFSLHHKDNLLGEIWTAGKKYESVKFSRPWHEQRGSLHISNRGHIKIAPRYYLPGQPQGDLLQAGPLLVHKGQSLILPGKDPEGISASSHQFDDDWTGEARFPRSAIGANDDFIFCVVTDGYSPPKELHKNAGLTLGEMAEIMLSLGATEALNLDGGSSATLIANGKLINKPRGGPKDKYRYFEQGREIPSAIIFEPVKLS
jgi:hypothetical protein